MREPSGEVITPQEEDDEFMILKTPEQVVEIAKVLPERTKAECRECYNRIDEEDYGFPLDEEDFEYTWEYLQDSLDFLEKSGRRKKDMYCSLLIDSCYEQVVQQIVNIHFDKVNNFL